MLLDGVRKRKPLKGPDVPKPVEEKVRRGRGAMLKDAVYRRLAVKMWTGDHYWFVSSKGALLQQSTVTATSGAGKPPHRIRNKYPFITMLVEAKVSAATQRTPGYDVHPSTGDRMDEEASNIAGQVAAYLYDKVHVRRATTEVVTNALVQREGFAMPFFDQNVGPFTQKVNLETGETEWVGRGEIKILTFSRSEVMWEPGVGFLDSRWHAIERAVPIDEVELFPGFYGGELTADASTSDVPSDRDRENMVRLTEYLERPCAKYPKGRRLVFANGKQIVPEEEYPAIGPDGEILDEPVIHRLSYTVNPEGDDLGLVERLIDLQRTVNDCWNKELEWKNRCLNPQMLAPKGSFPADFQRNDIPGYTNFYNPGREKPTWEQPPPIPTELRQMREDAIAHMRALAADIDAQAGADVAAKTIQAAVEQGNQRWQSFLGDLAEFHSRLMRHMLSLVQVYYDDERTLQVDGEYSFETLENFTGQDLRSQVNVRVSPGSLVSQSRQSISEEIQMINQIWPGAMKPEMGIAAIQGGTGKNMIRSYQNHVSQAWRTIQLCEKGMEALSQVPDRYDPDVPATDEAGNPIFQTGPDGLPIIDPATMQPVPVLGDDIPGWMPRKQANVDIWKELFANFMCTPRFERIPPEGQHVFDLVWAALEKIQQDRAMAEMTQRDMMAAGQGLDNAAAPQAPPPLPDRSGVTPQ